MGNGTSGQWSTTTVHSDASSFSSQIPVHTHFLFLHHRDSLKGFSKNDLGESRVSRLSRATCSRSRTSDTQGKKKKKRRGRNLTESFQEPANPPPPPPSDPSSRADRTGFSRQLQDPRKIHRKVPLHLPPPPQAGLK